MSFNAKKNVIQSHLNQCFGTVLYRSMCHISHGVRNRTGAQSEMKFNCLRRERAENGSKNLKHENCRKRFPKASTMTLRMPMYVAVFIHPHSVPFPYPTPPQHETLKLPRAFLNKFYLYFAPPMRSNSSKTSLCILLFDVSL